MSIWGNGIVVKDARKVPVSDHEFFAEVASGYWYRLHGSFYIREEDMWELPPWVVQRMKVIAVGLQVTSAVVVGKAAAVLWGFRPLAHEFVVELAYPEGRAVPPKRTQLENVRYRRQHFAPGHMVVHKGIRLTSAARTVVDVCRWDSFAEGLVVAEAYLRAGHSARRLQLTFDAMGKMHGKQSAQKVLAVASKKSRSAAESWAKAQLIEMGVDFAKVKQNPKMMVDGSKRLPDFLYEGWLVIEIDGEFKYDGSFDDPITAMRDERRREVQFLNDGFTLIRAGWAELKSGKFRTLVADALRRGRP